MQNYKFYIDEYVFELRQHINLSDSAWLVIKDDIKDFYETPEKESIDNFLNRIFRNYYQKADASINLRYLEKIQEMEKLYSSKEFANIKNEAIKLFIERYAKMYENTLKDKALSYPLGHGKKNFQKLRIDKKSLSILRDVEEANYYGNRIGLYLKAIFEEYSTKPKYIREQIFFANTLDEIKKSIANEKKIKISLLSKVTVDGKNTYTRKFYVSPYKIDQDKAGYYNYLIGYSEEIKDNETIDKEGHICKSSYTLEKSPCCFRLSRIEKADMMSSMGAHLSKDLVNELEKMIIERTAMFMPEKPIDIKLIFTPKGLELFRRQSHLRPQFYDIDKENKYLYTFHCGEIHAMNYFFKLGCHVKIIEPKSLRDKFINRYKKALDSYLEINNSVVNNNE